MSQHPTPPLHRPGLRKASQLNGRLREPRFAVNRLVLPCAVATGLAFGAAGAWGQSARSATVTFASADAVIVTAQGDRRPATNGLVLNSGDTIETGKGRVQLRMVDGGLMSLQPATTLRLDDYHLASDGGTDEKGYMSLLKGGLRTVSGFIGKARPDNYRLQTPTGMIGIRGTEYTAVLKDGLTVGVIGGRVAVCNDGGCTDVNRGMSAFVASRAERPVLSRLVSVVVPVSTPAGAASQQTTEVAQAATAAATPATVSRTSGEEVRGYLQALVQPAPQPATGNAVAAAPGGTGGTGGTGDTGGSGVSGGTGAAPVGSPTRPSPPANTSPPAATPTTPDPVTPTPTPAPVSPATPVAPPAPTAPVAPATPAAPVTPTSPPSPVVSTPAAPAPPAPPPAPVTPAQPAQPPEPAPPVDPVTAPPPVSPSPAFVQSPLLTSTGTVIAVSTDKNGETTGLEVSGYRTFSDGTLVQVREKDESGKPLLENATPVQAHADGIVAWGRWTAGKHSPSSAGADDNGSQGNGETTALHYFTFAGTPGLPVLKTFASFASTATTVTADKGVVMATGAENAATGTLRITFPGAAGGFATYNLSVPVAGQTFTLAGSAVQSNVYGFAGGASIASSGTGCAAGCSGALANGNAVQGMVGGTGSSRAGLVYGFTSGIGNVTGAMVFKP